MDTEQLEDVAKKMKYILERSFETDLIIRVIYNNETTEFKVHAAFLSIHSEVFESMLASTFIEGVTKIVEIREIDPKYFYLLIEYIYCGTVELKDVNEVWELYIVADRYLVNGAKELCTDFIEKHITVGNARKCWLMADCYNIDTIKVKSEKLIQKRTREVLRHNNFLESDVQTAKVVLLQEKLSVRECEVFSYFEQYIKLALAKHGKKMYDELLNNTLPYIAFLSMKEGEFIYGPGASNFIKESDKEALLSCIKCSEENLPFEHTLPPGFRDTKRICTFIDLDLTHMANFDKEIVNLGSDRRCRWISFRVNQNVFLKSVRVFTRENIHSLYEEDLKIYVREREKRWKPVTTFRGKVNPSATILIALDGSIHAKIGKTYFLGIWAEGDYKTVNLESAEVQADDINLKFFPFDNRNPPIIPLAGLTMQRS